MTDSTQLSWSRLMQWRSECYRRFGSVQDFPIRSVQDELKSLLYSGCRALDVGAGAHKPFQNAVTRVTTSYFSMDTDPNGDFDFRSFDEVPEDLSFDLIMANQVLEHLTVDDAFAMASAAFRSLASGGRILASVPNTAHPVRQRDCTHITPWPANDLYSLLRSAGFRVDTMARYNKFPLTSNPLKRWVVRTVCQEFRVDWCDSILAVGSKV